jgi:peptidoglycan/xylan/chitin deacetylase (PgdA/CDA1 family)
VTGVGSVIRIGGAALIGALLATGAGFAVLDQQAGSGVFARTLTEPGEWPEPRVVVPPPQSLPATAASEFVPSPPQASPLADDSAGALRVPPYLEAVDPRTAGIAVYAPIVMTFSQEMDRPSVEMSFAIQPKVEGRFVWRDDFTVQYEPFRLANSTAYQVEVRGRSMRGPTLSGPRRWTFSTVSGPPDVLAPGRNAVNVPILMYHYIRVNPDSRDRLGFNLSVTPTDFAAQMDWLARSGYHTITTEDLHGYLSGTRGLPSKPVILTFDDGYADFYTTALPVLRSHGFNADSYVVSGFVGRPGYMTSAQVREADRSGIEIGAHTVNHADLVRTSIAGVGSEVGDSKRFLEAVVGHPVVSFCYPSGKFNGAVVSEVAAAGFHTATTTRFGYSHSLADRYIWTRVRVSGGERLDQFAADLAGAS